MSWTSPVGTEIVSDSLVDLVDIKELRRGICDHDTSFNLASMAIDSCNVVNIPPPSPAFFRLNSDWWIATYVRPRISFRAPKTNCFTCHPNKYANMQINKQYWLFYLCLIGHDMYKHIVTSNSFVSWFSTGRYAYCTTWVMPGIYNINTIAIVLPLPS